MKQQQGIGLLLLDLPAPQRLDTPGHCDDFIGWSRGGVGSWQRGPEMQELASLSVAGIECLYSSAAPRQGTVFRKFL